MTNILDIVRTLRAAGLSIIPSGGGDKGKAPLVDWKPYQDRLPTDEEYKKWPVIYKPPLWGIVTGEISNVVVVDVDPGADLSIMEGFKPHVRTPRGGGHYYFKHPGHEVKTKANVLPKLDIRADGGFANIVGKNPRTGGEYTIKIMPSPETVYSWDQMPTAILGAMVKDELASDDEAGAIKALDGVPEGERDEDLYKYACRLFGLGLRRDEVTILVLTAASRATPPFPKKEALAKVESASKYERTPTPRQDKAPSIISARALSETDFPDLQFALPGMICEGFTEISGRPKSAKSIWALQAAFSVSIGKNLFDDSPCEKGRALFLGLEDGQRRLQYRINKLNGSHVKVSRNKSGGLRLDGVFHDVPEGLDITTEWNRIGDGGIERLEEYLDQHPDTRLIVVDITKRMMKRKGRGSLYDEDYDSVMPLQELATRRRVAILGVHHVRKASSDDPLEMVSGTYGRTGAADSVIVVKRETEDESRFSFIGKDIQERELAMRFDSERLKWTCLGDADIYFISEEREAILGCLLDNDSMTPSEIAKSLDKNVATVKTLLAKMLRAGIVTKDRKGKYSKRRSK